MDSITAQRPRVCLYCLSCYPLFNPAYSYPFGGWEIRISLIAKELAKRGNFDVTIFVANYGQPHIEYREGVRLISWPENKVGPAAEETETKNKVEVSDEESKAVRPRKGKKPLTRSIEEWIRRQHLSSETKVISVFLATQVILIAQALYANYLDALKIIVKEPIRSIDKVLRAFGQVADLRNSIFDILDKDGSHIVWCKDIERFDEAQADIYVVPGNHRTSAVAASYCQARQKKYVFLAGSDYDYYPEYKTDPNGFDLYGESYFQKAYAIEHASLHIVQNPRQANMLDQGYGRSGIVIRNPIDLSNALPRPVNPKTILWVGKSDERVKRPSLVLELARCLPEQQFTVILNRYDDKSYSYYSNQAQSLPNVTLIEYVPFNEVERYYAGARLFVSTSVFEGFPNTFLQAAKYGVPIVSTDVDPGRMLAEHNCGIVCGGDFERFVKSVQHLMVDNESYAKMSAAALNYVRAYHDKETVISQYERAFQETLENKDEYTKTAR